MNDNFNFIEFDNFKQKTEKVAQFLCILGILNEKC